MRLISIQVLSSALLGFPRANGERQTGSSRGGALGRVMNISRTNETSINEAQKSVLPRRQTGSRVCLRVLPTAWGARICVNPAEKVMSTTG